MFTACYVILNQPALSLFSLSRSLETVTKYTNIKTQLNRLIFPQQLSVKPNPQKWISWGCCRGPDSFPSAKPPGSKYGRLKKCPHVQSTQMSATSSVHTSKVILKFSTKTLFAVNRAHHNKINLTPASLVNATDQNSMQWTWKAILNNLCCWQLKTLVKLEKAVHVDDSWCVS